MPIDLPTVVGIEMSDNERNRAVTRNRSVPERICNTHKSTFIVDALRDLSSKGIRNKVARLTTEFVESEFLLAKQIKHCNFAILPCPFYDDFSMSLINVFLCYPILRSFPLTNFSILFIHLVRKERDGILKKR